MITVIIAYYRNIPALNLIFKALERQTFREFEVIVAEDDNDEATNLFLQENRQKYFFPVLHVCHEDMGFRKNKIMNDAIRISRGEKLVFIDGDCVPHRRFLEMYSKHSKKRTYYYGRRVYVSGSLTEKALNEQNPELFSLLNLCLSRSRKIFEGVFLPFRPTIKKEDREIWGCNWGILKEYILRVNGFDEDYTLPCYGEDLDIGWRLKKIGIKLTSLKNRAIQYHLHHEARYDEAIMAAGRKMYESKKSEGFSYCKNGIKKI